MQLDLSKQDRGVFLVNILGIIYNPKTKKILIGRREKDTLVKELKWCFPGGRPAYEKSLENYLKHEIKIKTNLNVKIKRLILARVPPENKQFLLLYYYCEAAGKAKPGEKFVEVKWINPDEIKKYFTTSIHPEIIKFLKSLIYLPPK